MSQSGYYLGPSKNVSGTAFNDGLATIKNATPEQNASFSGYIKIMLFIILSLVICSCCLICFMNDMDILKIFSSSTVDLLCCINCLTIIGLFLALIFGFHSFSTSDTGQAYLNQFYNPNIVQTSKPLNPNVQNLMGNQNIGTGSGYDFELQPLTGKRP